MFNKLTTRERTLAYVVIALLPAMLAFIGVFWFLGKYNANKVTEISLMAQIGDEEIRMATAAKADRRRAYYDSISLPSELEDASNDYQSWMKGLVRNELNMKFKSLTPNDVSDLKNENEVIGQRRTYLLRADGTLDQLTDLLARFYSSDLLHRINSLKITAQNETSGSNKKIRTGLLGITAKIEVLSLNTALEKSEFLDRFEAQQARESRFAEINKAYRDMVVRRDIFGPPNNTPTLAASPKRSGYTSETEAKFSLTAKDADEDDLMTFEIIESSVEGWKLEPSEPGARTVSFTVPGQKAGTYSFKAKVADNGFPAKESIEEFSVKFEDPVVKKEEPKAPDPPPFVNAKETQITGIVLENTGDWRVWIKVRTTGDKYKLKVGESFELDKQTWVVEKIEPKQAVLRVDNKLLTFKPTDRFVDPRNEVILDVPATDTLKTPPEKGAKIDFESDAAPKPRTS